MVRLKSEFLALTVISEYQDFLTIKTFMDFLILIFVISTSDSISEHTFYSSKRKKNFFVIPVGDHRSQNFFFELVQDWPIKYD